MTTPSVPPRKPRGARRWVLAVLLTVVGLLAAVAALVIVVDPFQHYRKATFFTPVIDGTRQAYYNIGIARNYPYDTLMLGSSMTENSHPSDVEAALGGQAVNLPFSGGTLRNYAVMLDEVLPRRPLRRVLICLDSFAMYADPDEVPIDLPSYLYDHTLLTDVSYWFNIGVLERIWEVYQVNREGLRSELNLDTLYEWDGQVNYGRELVLTGHTFPPGDPLPPIPREGRVEEVRGNIERHLLHYIDAYPETEFIFYFPPYSQLQWYTDYMNGLLDRQMYYRERYAEALLSRPNVRLFDFQAVEEWVCDLDNYKDMAHHSGEINARIIEAIGQDAYRLYSMEEVAQNNEVLTELACTFVPPTPEEIKDMREFLEAYLREF